MTWAISQTTLSPLKQRPSLLPREPTRQLDASSCPPGRLRVSEPTSLKSRVPEGMHRFINNRGGFRTGSPVPSPSRQPENLSLEERRRRGTAARADVPNTGANESQYDSDEQPPRQESMRPPQSSAVRVQHAGQTTTLVHRYDDFDTDPENADATTLTNFSNFQQESVYDQHQYQGDEDEGDFNGDDSQFAEDEESEDEETPRRNAQKPSNVTDGDIDVLRASARQTGDAFAASHSYPTTTNPDEEDEPEDIFDDRGQGAFHPEPPEVGTRSPWPTPQEPSPPTAPYTSHDPYPRLRQEARPVEKIGSDTNLPLRNGTIRVRPARPLSTTSVQHAQQQQSHMNRPSIDQQQPARQISRHSPTPSNAETINERNFFGAETEQYPLTPSEASPVVPLDYDEEILFKMNYSELHGESFDFEPRNDPAKQHLAHLKDSPLEDRLQTAFKELHPNDQIKFFSTLNLEEWEEAGDWFLGQFGDLLKRFKDARRKKRSSAREFEDAIRARDDEISRKRQCVEDHIVEMKGKGQQLLPETPSRRARMSRAGTPR